jgi:hypothetical protein
MEKFFYKGVKPEFFVTGDKSFYIVDENDIYEDEVKICSDDKYETTYSTYRLKIYSNFELFAYVYIDTRERNNYQVVDFTQNKSEGVTVSPILNKENTSVIGFDLRKISG